jgi:hypothetical protein
MWHKLGNAAGVRPIRLHDARHSCGTALHLRGVPLAVIAKWLGHADASITARLYTYSQGEALRGLQSLFLPGFEPITVFPGQPAIVPVTPTGLLGALAPVGALPGQMAQSLTNLMPPGSILAQMSQNATNTISALTDLNTTVNPLIGVGFLGALAPVNFGVGLQLVVDGIGAPGNALAALNSSAVAFTGAVQAGNASAAIAAVLTAPADMANGFLNGSTLITLPDVNVTSLLNQQVTAGTQVVVGGLLAPLSPPTQSANPLGIITVGQAPGASETGGLIPGLQSIGAQLAAGITPA